MPGNKVFLVLLDELLSPAPHGLHPNKNQLELARFTFTKFLRAFSAHGYEYHDIHAIQQIQEINNKDIVFVSDHGLERSEKVLDLISKIGKRNAKMILWFWHDYLDMVETHFKESFVLTGEHFHHKPKNEEHLKRWNIEQNIDYHVPLTFASKLLPEVIGSLPRSENYLAHFVGAHYKRHWNLALRAQFRNIKVVNTPPFISESERERIFLSSGIALGWHSDANIENHVVVERVFEGLAYGNFVISDNHTAHQITDGIVETTASYLQTQDWVKRYERDKKFRNLKEKQGYAWAKSNGTYTSVAARFIQRLNG